MIKYTEKYVGSTEIPVSHPLFYRVPFTVIESLPLSWVLLRIGPHSTKVKGFREKQAYPAANGAV